MTPIRQHLRSFAPCSCFPGLLLGCFVFLSPSPAAAQDPDPEQAIEMLRQLRGALEGLRGAPIRRSEHALTGSVTVTNHRDWGGSHNHCDIVAHFTLLPFTAFHRDWGSEEVDASASVTAGGRTRNPGGTYTTWKIEGNGPVAAGVSLTVQEDGTYELRFTSGAVEATETTHYPNQPPLVQPTRQCEYSVTLSDLPAPREAKIFHGSRTDERGATVQWSFRPEQD